MTTAADGTILGLHAALLERMAEVARAFWNLETKRASRSPKVVGGWLPPKRAGGAEAEDFPFILVRPRTGTDAEEDARATVDILVGTCSDTDDGWHDVLLVVDAIRQDLEAAPVVGECAQLVLPLTWELLEEQPRPQWMGRITATFTVPLPVRVDARNPRSAA